MSVKCNITTLDDSSILIVYNDYLMSEPRGLIMNHGDIISNMIRADEQEIRKEYTAIADKAINTYFKIYYGEERSGGKGGPMGSKLFLAISEELRPMVLRVDLAYPAVMFYSHILSQLIADLLTSPVYDFNVADEIVNMAEYDSAMRKHYKLMPRENKMDKPIVVEYFQMCIDVLMADIAEWRKSAVREATRIYKLQNDEESDYPSLDGAERLYFLDNTVDFEESSNVFKYAAITYTSAIVREPVKLDSAESFNGEIARRGSKPRYLNTFDLPDTEKLLEYDFLHIIKEGSLIKLCRHCGRLFLPRGRQDTEYCDYPAPGEPKTCSQIGALRKYEAKVKSSPVLKAYNKAYKRMSGRVKYGMITRTDFANWSKEARVKRDMCEAGEIELADYEKWLGNRSVDNVS